MGVFDWTGAGFSDSFGGSDWWDFGGDGLGGSTGDGFDWSSLGSDSGSSGSSSSGWMSKLFGSGGSGSGDSSSMMTNIFGGLLSGLSAAAKSKSDSKSMLEAVKAQGTEQRKTSAFEASLLDYYKQKDKVRKRAALDSYGSYSVMPKTTAAPIDMPSLPTAS
jgi:hypothetical protein